MIVMINLALVCMPMYTISRKMMPLFDYNCCFLIDFCNFCNVWNRNQYPCKTCYFTLTTSPHYLTQQKHKNSRPFPVVCFVQPVVCSFHRKLFNVPIFLSFFTSLENYFSNLLAENILHSLNFFIIFFLQNLKFNFNTFNTRHECLFMTYDVSKLWHHQTIK